MSASKKGMKKDAVPMEDGQNPGPFPPEERADKKGKPHFTAGRQNPQAVPQSKWVSKFIENTSEVFQIIDDLEEQLDSAASIRQVMKEELSADKTLINKLEKQRDELNKRVEFLGTCEKQSHKLQSEVDALKEENNNRICNNT